ncbi:transporter substrate-binding domain-containing protein [Marixanthomonas sp. SCSIO 43207]|uniref:substrate-binding periplasmic protein n=1 Tax=Marixanthomonas sp. SCSIO 43207 TaxID=2779360 RepID=UPI001CA9592B|nr:transporter substrate-binding domain-containing protein [Marixanthomonas sp. SCSIO 43207]UAB80961.1 transporter substrate-binding domain-containing protein [Marixanthomonas sp. SCSIO 43207]
MTKYTKFLGLIAIALFLIACNGNKTETNTTESKYDKIIESGKIKVGYISYPPSFIVGADGNKSGIFYEVMEKIGENLGLEIVYQEEVTWDGMIESVKQGKIDMVVTGIWPTSQRGKHVDFAKPLFYSVVKAYTAYGNDKFDNNLDAINSSDVIISTIDGEMTSIIANFDFPKAKQQAVTQLTGVSQTLLEIKSKKADVTFVEPAIALEFASKNPNSIQEVKGVEPLRVFPNSMLLPKGSVKLRTTLNIAIEELQNNGFVDKVIAKYEKYPNSYYKVQSPYKSNN